MNILILTDIEKQMKIILILIVIYYFVLLILAMFKHSNALLNDKQFSFLQR